VVDEAGPGTIVGAGVEYTGPLTGPPIAGPYPPPLQLSQAGAHWSHWSYGWQQSARRPKPQQLQPTEAPVMAASAVKISSFFMARLSITKRNREGGDGRYDLGRATLHHIG
jgi:hypothetical protein